MILNASHCKGIPATQVLFLEEIRPKQFLKGVNSASLEVLWAPFGRYWYNTRIPVIRGVMNTIP